MAQIVLLLFLVEFGAILVTSKSNYIATGQNLKDVPDDIPPGTVTIDFSNNDLGNATWSKLSGLNLRKIILKLNGLPSFPNLEAVGTTLAILKLRNNDISSIDPSDIDGLEILRELDLSGNRFTAFPNLSVIGQSLQYLKMVENELQRIVPSDVEHLVNLTYLFLQDNVDLATADLSPLGDTLLHLSLSRCDSSASSSIETAFNGFTKLDTLQLNERSLPALPDLSTACSKLTDLSARKNRITLIDPSYIEHCVAMKFFNLNDNLLTALPSITAMGTTLRNLSVSNNRISGLNQTVMLSLTALENVDFSYNLLTDFPDFSNSGASLTFLNLMRNRIEVIPPVALGSLTSLESLDLSNNFLTMIPDAILPKLTFLNLANNNFTAMPSLSKLGSLQILNLSSTSYKTDRDMANLTDLFLAHTPIRTASPRVFAQLGRLQVVDLRNTELTEIPTMCPESSLTLHLENNSHLDLCSSKMAWLKQSFFTVTYTDLMCDSIGKMWSAATFEDLVQASHRAPQPGDVKQLFTGSKLTNTFCPWPTSSIWNSGNFKTCFRACLNSQDCSSLNYNPDTMQCVLVVPTTGHEDPRTQDGSGWNYYFP